MHNNTTPEDVPICEALLAFLRADGDISEYWRVLHENDITAERLASYDRAITFEPWLEAGAVDARDAIPDFEHYLETLKRVHSSDDVNGLIEEVWDQVGPLTQGLLKDVVDNLQDEDAISQMSRVHLARENLVTNIE